jgi:hypothetical protein
MGRSFIDRHFTFEEHQNYYPLFEELVFYAKQWGEQNAHQNATLDQAMTLVKFGSAFDVQDHQYWRTAQSLVEHCLEHSKKTSIDEILQIATLTKEFGLLSNKILRHVAKHFHEIKTMTPNQLSLFTMVYTSDEMRAAFEINKEGT